MVAISAVCLLTAWGVDAREIASFGGYLLVVVALPGNVVWRLLGTTLLYGAENCALGVAVGYAVEVLARLAAQLLGAPPWSGAGALVVAALVVLAVPGTRRRVLRPSVMLPTKVAWAYAVVLMVVLLWFAQAYFARQPLSWSGAGGPENDLLFALSLAGEVLHRWPLEFPWVSGEPLFYHWFFAQHLASASEISRVGLPVLLLRLDIVPMVMVVAMGTGALARQLAGRVGAGPVAAGVLFVVQDLAPVPWRELFGSVPPNIVGVPYDASFWWSTSEAFGAAVFAGIAVVFVELLRAPVPRRRWILLALLLIAGAGAKASILPVVIASCAWTLVRLSVRDRRLHGRGLATVLLAISVFVPAWWLIYGGRPQGLQLSPLRYVMTTALGTGVLGDSVKGRTPLIALAVAVLCVVSLLGPYVAALLVRPNCIGTHDPAVQIAVGATVFGACAVVGLYHVGQSNLYFLRTALPLLAAVAAWGVTSGVARLCVPTRTAMVAIGAGVTTGGLLGLKNWLAFHPSQEALDRLVHASVPWLVLLGAAALVASSGRMLRRRDRSQGQYGSVLMVLFVMGWAAFRVPAQAAAWTAQHSFGWSDRKANHYQAIDDSSVDGAVWIRDHAQPDELVLTNALCNGRGTTEGQCDNLTFWVTAYSERRTLLSGWGYTPTANRLAVGSPVPYVQIPYWDQETLRSIKDFFVSPTVGKATQFRNKGVRWVLVVPGHERVSPAISTVATLTYRKGSTAVYRL